MEENDQLLMGLIYSLSETAMVALGKVQNPVSQKIEKNMDLAKIQIDMIRMLQQKTKGNVPKEIDSFVASTLSTLELTYVQEQNKPAEKEAAAKQPEQENKTTAEESAKAETTAEKGSSNTAAAAESNKKK